MTRADARGSKKSHGQADLLPQRAGPQPPRTARAGIVIDPASGHIRDQSETEGDLFIITSRVMIFLWVVVCIGLGMYGQGIQPT